MKHQILIAAGLAVAATGIATTPVSAGPFDKLKKAVKKVEKAAEDANTAVEVVEETRRTKGRNVVGAVVARQSVRDMQAAPRRLRPSSLR